MHGQDTSYHDVDVPVHWMRLVSRALCALHLLKLFGDLAGSVLHVSDSKLKTLENFNDIALRGVILLNELVKADLSIMILIQLIEQLITNLSIGVDSLSVLVLRELGASIPVLSHGHHVVDQLLLVHKAIAISVDCVELAFQLNPHALKPSFLLDHLW